MASFHPAQSDELVITAEKAAQILVDNKPYSPAAEVIELTSQALIENSCSAQLVIKPAKPTSSAVVPPAPKNRITPATKVIIDNSLVSNLKPIGQNIWQSPGGIIYEPGSRHGHRIMHILEHSSPNLNKVNHTVFSVPRDKILALIDEAWALGKSVQPLVQPNKNELYTIPMKRIVGTNGETAVQIVVKNGTSTIITAFPVK